MKSKLKNFLIYIIVFFIIFFSFLLPNILFEFFDDNLLSISYVKEKNVNKIDIQAKNIYLVKAIHDIEDGGYGNVKIDNSTAIQWIKDDKSNSKENKVIKIENEIGKMVENNILQLDFSDKENKKFKLSIIEKNYQNTKTGYIMQKVDISLNTFNINAEIEKKTGKILYISLPKEYIVDSLNRKEIMENYIKYLELFIIDDWEYKDDIYISKKAGLFVNFNFYSEDMCFFTVHSTSIMENYMIIN